MNFLISFNGTTGYQHRKEIKSYLQFILDNTRSTKDVKVKGKTATFLEK